MIYDAHKQAHNKEKEIKVLSLSSNRKKNLDMEIGVIFLGGFLMPRPKSCYKWRSKVSGQIEDFWRMK